VLVAAGPDLPARLDYLQSVSESAVIIAVNNALKPMLAAGVRPHFVVANDTSVHTAKSWEGLGRLPDVSLVAHCLTDLGGEVFGQKFLFGEALPELFGGRPNLRLHGSVITTAFSLARYMGCERCVLSGAQLCSPDPWKLAYSQGSIHESIHAARSGQPLTNAWPQLAPVRDMAGNRRYTTLNFLDAAHWLRDEIRLSGIPCVTLTAETLVHGPGIRHVPDFPIQPTGRLERRLGRIAASRAAAVARASVEDFVRRELATWDSVAQLTLALLGRSDEGFVAAASQALAQFDASGVSYLVQRFEDFKNYHLHDKVFLPSPEESKAEGLRYYLEYVGRMAQCFAEMLEAQLPLP